VYDFTGQIGIVRNVRRFLGYVDSGNFVSEGGAAAESQRQNRFGYGKYLFLAEQSEH